MRKSSYFVFWIVFGIALAAVSFFIPDSLKSLKGVMIGVGAGLSVTFLSKYLSRRYEIKHPDIFKRSQIEQQDERNQQIRWKSKGKSADVIQWFILGLAYIMIFLDLPLWLTALTVGIFVLKSILEAVFFSRCQKEM